METECPTKQLNFAKKQAGEGGKATVYDSGSSFGHSELAFPDHRWN